MWRRLSIVLACVPSIALADYYPYVTKGPVITGVSDSEAWIAWATAHHEGNGTQCTIEANTPFVGNGNDDTPTVALSPASADGTTFTDPTCARDHRVHLTGLSPATRYTFSLDKTLEDGTPVAGEFRTATTDPGARFSFVVYGDNRDSQFTQTHRSDHEAVSDGIVANEPDAAFLLHTGDLALNLIGVSGDDQGYTEFFDVERGLLSTKPAFVVIGNHETIDTSEYDTLVNPNVFAGSPHPYYSSFDWGGVHVALLDAFEGPPQLGGLGGLGPEVSDEQVAWLEADLAAAEAAGKAIFVVAHQSPFSYPDPNESSGHGGSVPMQEKVVPVLLRHRAMAVFGGHDHYYQRGHEQCLDWFVVGGGGAPMYEPDPSAAGVAVAVMSTSYVVVHVDGTHATAEAKTPSGAILDTFTFQPADGTSCGVPPSSVDAGPGEVDAGGVPDAGNVSVDAGPVDAGTDVVDAGPDAGVVVGVDAGDVVVSDAGVDAGDVPGAPSDGCGCGSAGLAWLPGLLVLVGRRRWSVRGR